MGIFLLGHGTKWENGLAANLPASLPLAVFYYATDTDQIFLGTGIDHIQIGGSTVAGSNGQVQFNGSGALAGDANLFWDNTSKRLGIDIAAPGFPLEVRGGNPQIVAKSVSAAAQIGVDGHTGNQASIPFSTDGTQKWSLGRQTDDSFFLFDAVNSHTVLSAITGASGQFNIFPNADGITTIGGSPNLTQDTGRYGSQALRIQSPGTNSSSVLTIMPGIGTALGGASSGIRLYNAANNTNVGALELDVTGTAALLDSFSFGTGSAPTTFEFHNLKIGINLTPAVPLDVQPQVSGDAVYFRDTSGNVKMAYNGSVPQFSFAAGAGGSPPNIFLFSDNFATPTLVLSPSDGSVNFYNSGVSKFSFKVEGTSSLVVRNAVSGGDRWWMAIAVPEEIDLFGGANNTSAALLDLKAGSIRIDAGNLGIRTAPTSTYPLDVAGDARVNNIYTNGPISYFDVRAFGAKGDTQIVYDASGNPTGNHVTSATANFTSADVGKSCWFVQGNSFALFSTAATITAFNSSTDVTISATIPGGGSYPGTFVWGTDDSTAIASAVTAAKAVADSFSSGTRHKPQATVFFPRGWYLVNANPTIDGGGKINVKGAGYWDTVLYFGPTFPFSNTGAGNIITNVDDLSDISIDGTSCNETLGNITLVSLNGACRRVYIQNWKASSGGNNLALYMPTDDGIIEDTFLRVDCNAVGIASLHFTINRLEATSNSEIALQCVDTSNIHVIDSHIVGHIGVQDGPNNNITNWTFVGCRITGTASAFNLTMPGTVLRLSDCWIEGTPAFTLGASASPVLTAAANASGGTTTYTGTFPANIQLNNYVTIAGFLTAANNGVFLAVSGNSTTLVVNNPNGVAETHAGTATWGITVYADNCDIIGDGTNAISNSGTFYDLGGNTIQGALAGSGVYNAVATGIARVDLTGQSAAIANNTVYIVPSNGGGQYLLSWNAKVTTAAGTSSTLGALTVKYTDPDGVVQTITCAAQSNAGAIETTDAGNATTTVLLGLPVLLNCKANTNIQYAFAYASNAANAMHYNLHMKIQAV